MNARYFYGWNVVGATFVMALLSFGLGFYGLSVYVASLQRLHGWSASAVSAPVTVYYVAGALVAPVLIPLIGAVGFATTLALAALTLVLVLVPVAGVVMRRNPEDLGLDPDGDRQVSRPAVSSPSLAGGWRGEAMRTWRFW